MKRKSFINTMATCILSMCLANAVLCSCSDDDEGKDDVPVTIEWNIDEEKTICLEDYIPNIGKDCEISDLDPEMVSIEYVGSRNVHILHPVKYVGMTKPVITTPSGRKYHLNIRVYNDIVRDLWELEDRAYNIEKDIVCNNNIKDNIEADLKERNVFWNNFEALCFNNIRDVIRFWNSCDFYYNGNAGGNEGDNNSNKNNRSAFFQYDINTDECTFIDRYDIYLRQTMKVTVTEKSDNTGSRFRRKKADFEFDITKEMQDKYGAENVKRVSIVYHLHNFRLP